MRDDTYTTKDVADSSVLGADAPIVIRTEHITKRFIIHKDKSLKERALHPRRSRNHREDFWALNDVSIDIHAGETIGLIGPNGSGKSTLLKTIGGIIEPTSGTVLTRGRMAALLELGAGFHPDLTGRENVYLNASILGMSRDETDELFDDIVEFSGIGQFIDTQVKFYSSGMYVRLAFAVAINVDPDILLVDEVLAVGDESFQKKCLDKIRQFQEQGRTIVLVSHGLDQIVEFCSRAIVLGQGTVVFDGEPEDAVSILRAGFNTIEESDAAKERIARERAREAELQRLHEQLDIVSVVSTPSDGEILRPGGTLDVDISLVSRAVFRDWDLTIALVNSLGTTVTATSTHVSGLRNASLGSAATVRFRLPNISLGGGRYTVTCAFFDEHRREIQRVEGLGEFQAEAGGESIGPVYAVVESSFIHSPETA